MADLEREVALWREVLAHASGCGLDLFGGLLHARRNEDGTFEVSWEGTAAPTDYETFANADDAARFFAAKRREMQLGYEFEVGR